MGSCNQRVQFALVDARTTGCLTLTSTAPDTYESTDTVNLNGIPLRAIPGTRLVLKGPSSSAPKSRPRPIPDQVLPQRPSFHHALS